MSISGFPVSATLHVTNPIVGAHNPPAPKSTESTSDLNNPTAQTPSDAHTAGENSPEGSARVKRGIKLPGFPRIFPRPKPPKIDVPNGTPGIFRPKPTIPTRPVDGSQNSNAISNFRNLVFRTQHPGSPLSGPVKPVVTKPSTFGDVATNLVAADRLVKAGVFKTDSSLKTVTRDAFVNASVNGLVSTPLSIGTYAGSVWSGEHIKGSFSANTPLLPPAHQPAPSQQTNGVTAGQDRTGEQDAEIINLRLDNAELKMVFAVNTIQALVEGGEGNALGKHPNWPTEINARLDTIEKQYMAAEKNLAAFAEENDFVFKPYKDESAATLKSVTERLSALDKRNDTINKGIGRITAIRMLEVQDNQSIA